MQCISMGDELKFLKPTGHDQFQASLAASKTLSKFPVEDLQGPMKDEEFLNEIHHLDY